jgi:hypothetical protein
MKFLSRLGAGNILKPLVRDVHNYFYLFSPLFFLVSLPGLVTLHYSKPCRLGTISFVQWLVPVLAHLSETVLSVYDCFQAYC